MREAGPSGFERWLKSIALKPSPQGLRAKVLRAAAQSRENALWTTPLLRRWLAACAAVLLVVSLADGLVSRAQRVRFIAMAGGPRPSPVRPEDDASVLVEVLGDAATSRLVAEETAVRRRRPVRKPAAAELRELELIMEGADESQKDLH